MEIYPICIKCNNHIKDRKCKAFGVIPSIIWLEGDAHSEPLKGQKNNTVFEPIKNK